MAVVRRRFPSWIVTKIMTVFRERPGQSASVRERTISAAVIECTAENAQYRYIYIASTIIIIDLEGRSLQVYNNVIIPISLSIYYK